MMLPVPVLVQESVQEIVPYTASGHIIEILNYPEKYRFQAFVGNLICPIATHVLCKYCYFPWLQLTTTNLIP